MISWWWRHSSTHSADTDCQRGAVNRTCQASGAWTLQDFSTRWGGGRETQIYFSMQARCFSIKMCLYGVRVDTKKKLRQWSRHWNITGSQRLKTTNSLSQKINFLQTSIWRKHFLEDSFWTASRLLNLAGSGGLRRPKTFLVPNVIMLPTNVDLTKTF